MSYIPGMLQLESRKTIQQNRKCYHFKVTLQFIFQFFSRLHSRHIFGFNKYQISEQNDITHLNIKCNQISTNFLEMLSCIKQVSEEGRKSEMIQIQEKNLDNIHIYIFYHIIKVF